MVEFLMLIDDVQKFLQLIEVYFRFLIESDHGH
jgi:hypothetical protein